MIQILNDNAVLIAVTILIIGLFWFKPDIKGWIQTLNQNTMGPVAIIAVVGGLTLMWFKPDLKSEALAIVMLVLTFYFGSSPGSRRKDEHLMSLTQSLTQGGSSNANQPTTSVPGSDLPGGPSGGVRGQPESTQPGSGGSPG